MWCDFIFESVPNLVFWGLCAMIGALYHKVKSLKEIIEFNSDINKQQLQAIYQDIEKLKLASGLLVFTSHGVKEKYNGK